MRAPRTGRGPRLSTSPSRSLPKLGVPEIDAQHEQMERVIRALEAVVTANRPPALQAALLARLEQVTVAHFATEEQLMAAACFPYFHEHKGLHDLLKRQLRDLREKQSPGRGSLTRETLASLGRWFLDHVANVDQKLTQYLIAQSRPARR